MSEEQIEQQNKQRPNSPDQDELSEQELNNVSGGYDPTVIDPDAWKNGLNNGDPSGADPVPNGPASKV